MMKKLGKNLRINPLGMKRITLRMRSMNIRDEVMSPEGRIFSNSRIVVEFTEGDTERKIADFEAFCEGKLLHQLQLSGVCVFEVQPTTYRKLVLLVTRARMLDYVVTAHLDGVSQLHSTENNNVTY